jgi:spore coat polysaccharide biosynthesis predicted glycosyltransferase SpsG/SAM-dependent methyltransferase
VNKYVVLFCTVAGARYGYGHLKRCMTLIDQGRDLFKGILCIRGNAYRLTEYEKMHGTLPIVSSLDEAGSVDLIFSDQRDTTARVMRKYSKKAPVIALDDRGAGRSLAHVAIFSLPTVEGYRGNFAGPDYISIDTAVRELGKKGCMTHGDAEPTEVVVSFGGSDPHNLTGRVTGSLNRIGLRPTVVRGPLFEHGPVKGDYRLVEHPSSLAETLSRAAVLITSFGLTLFEARYLGIPVILLNHTQYHEQLAAAMDGVINLGYHASIDENALGKLLEEALEQCRATHGRKAHLDVDGRGSERIISIIDKALHARRRGCFFRHGAYVSLKRDENHTLMVCRKCRDTFVFELAGQGNLYDKGDYFLSEYEAQYGKSYIDDRPNISRMARTRLDIIESLLYRNGRQKRKHGRKPTSQPARKLSRRLAPGPKGRLLDVGCALGFFLDVARTRGWETGGVEVSPFAANWARDNLDLSVLGGSFLDAAIEDESLDVITFFFVAEHFKDVEKVIERAYAALKRGGFIVCALPNVRGISARIAMKRFVTNHPRDHYYDTCPRNLVRFMKDHGFHKRRIHVTGIHPERLYDRLGIGAGYSLLNAVYGAVARIFRLGDTFEYYGSKI